MRRRTKQCIEVFLILCILSFPGCTSHASGTIEDASASEPSVANDPEYADAQETLSADQASTADSESLKEILQGNKQDLERIAEDLIALEYTAEQPFSMDYQLYSGDLYVSLANSATPSEEIDHDAVLGIVGQVHSNAVLEDTFEFICVETNREWLPPYVCEFVLPAFIDASGCHHLLSLCYCPVEAPSTLKYGTVEKLDSHWFILEEIME